MTAATASVQMGQPVRVTGCIKETVHPHDGETGRLVETPCVGEPHLHVLIGSHDVCCTTSVEPVTDTGPP
jgi:hypothetical protein